MKKKFSAKWKSSKKPSKQRKFRANAPLHIKNRALSAHLAKELMKKHSRRSIQIRKGDSVKVMSGQFRGKSGKIERVDAKKSKAYITGIEFIKKDGSKSLYPVHASNLLVQELSLEDSRRMKKKGGKSR